MMAARKGANGEVDVDLDDLLAQRNESAFPTTTVRLGGQTFTVRSSISFEGAEALQRGDLEQFAAAICPDPDDAAKLNRYLDETVFRAFLENVWGVDPEDLQVSPTSSGDGGTSAKPTSKRTTNSTSAKRSGDQITSGSGG